MREMSNNFSDARYFILLKNYIHNLSSCFFQLTSMASNLEEVMEDILPNGTLAVNFGYYLINLFSIKPCIVMYPKEIY